MYRILLLIFIPLFSLGQGNENSEINFVRGFTMKQIIEKAKIEHKYVFIDCFATWCGPCKKMEKDVFSSAQVASFYNDHFISVRAQMDTTKFDDENTRGWYNEVQKIKKEYDINAYPTFLFISNEGTLVHKVVGGFSVDKFIEVGEDAFDIHKQYYALLAKYEKGSVSREDLKNLARSTKSFGNLDLAQKMADDYLEGLSDKRLHNPSERSFLEEFLKSNLAKNIATTYFKSLKKNELFKRGNILFIAKSTGSSKDFGFSFFSDKHKQQRIDDAMNVPGFSRNKVDAIIDKEEIRPVVFPNDKASVSMPDWIGMQNHIQRKYGADYAERIILSAKVRWYGEKELWPEYTSAAVNYITRFGKYFITPYLNSAAWNVFIHSDEKKELISARDWMRDVINKDSVSFINIDTYANLLYKLGQVEEALIQEEKALKIASEGGEKVYARLCAEVLKKMKAGVPTWRN